MIISLVRNSFIICLLGVSACSENPDDACANVSGDFTYGASVTEPSESCVWNGSLDPGIAVPNPVPTLLDGAEAGVFTSTPEGLVFRDASTGEIDLQASHAGSYVITNTLADCNVQATAEFDILPPETLTVQEVHFVVDGVDRNMHYYIIAEKKHIPS